MIHPMIQPIGPIIIVNAAHNPTNPATSEGSINHIALTIASNAVNHATIYPIHVARTGFACTHSPNLPIKGTIAFVS